VERTGLFEPPAPHALVWECGAAQWQAVGAVGSPGTEKRSSQQAGVSQSGASSVGSTAWEVCAVIASTGWSSHYLSALCEPSQRLFNFPLLPTPPPGEVWLVPTGEIVMQERDSRVGRKLWTME